MSALLALLLAAAPPALTIDRAVERALRSGARALGPEEGGGGRRRQVGEAYSGYFPRVSVEASYLRQASKERAADRPDADPGRACGGRHRRHPPLSRRSEARLSALRSHARAAGRRREGQGGGGEAATPRAWPRKLAFRVRATYLAALLARDLERIAVGVVEGGARRGEAGGVRDRGRHRDARRAGARSRVRVASLEAQDSARRASSIATSREPAEPARNRRAPSARG